ncbi:MAG TPA: hypothetical protein PKB10_04060 [Tepidisphaeraceae bacterium]|nr:hypothetical protein [Tepidisphaeraceae bacterium]
MLLTIRDETATGGITGELTLDVLDETITVRELIRSRVYQEVQDHNLAHRQSAGRFRGLVQPSEIEQQLNGPPRAPREIDWKKQFNVACEAFERNGFFILIDDRQADSLDETITLRHDTTISFVKLTPLVGG